MTNKLNFNYLLYDNYKIFYKDKVFYDLKEGLKYYEDVKTDLLIPENPSFENKSIVSRYIPFSSGSLKLLCQLYRIQQISKTERIKFPDFYHCYHLIDNQKNRMFLSPGEYTKLGYYLNKNFPKQLKSFLEKLFTVLEREGYTIISDTAASRYNFSEVHRLYPEVETMSYKQLIKINFEELVESICGFKFSQFYGKDVIYCTLSNNIIAYYLYYNHRNTRKKGLNGAMPLTIFRHRNP